MNIYILIIVVMLLCYLKGRKDGSTEEITVQNVINVDATKATIQYNPLRRSGRTNRMLDVIVQTIMVQEVPEIWVVGRDLTHLSDLRHRLLRKCEGFGVDINRRGQDTFAVNGITVCFVTFERIQQDPMRHYAGRNMNDIKQFFDHYTVEY